MPTTSKMPVQTPALKIPPMAWQLASVLQKARSKNAGNANGYLFILVVLKMMSLRITGQPLKYADDNFYLAGILLGL